MDVASRYAKPDRGVLIFDDLWEEAMCVAALAICAGDDPDKETAAFVKDQRQWAPARLPDPLRVARPRQPCYVTEFSTVLPTGPNVTKWGRDTPRTLQVGLQQGTGRFHTQWQAGGEAIVSHCVKLNHYNGVAVVNH
jgi:hypothetical protein